LQIDPSLSLAGTAKSAITLVVIKADRGATAEGISGIRSVTVSGIRRGRYENFYVVFLLFQRVGRD
jgi:hypothetical protein